MNTTKAILISVIVSVVVFALGFGLLATQTGSANHTYGIQAQNDQWAFTGSILLGPTTKGSELDLVESSSTTLPTLTIGPVTSATSSYFTTTTVPLGGYPYKLAVGDSCLAWISTAPTTTAFGLDAGVDSIINTTTTQAAVVGVTLWNGTSTAVTINTSTLALSCFHTPY